LGLDSIGGLSLLKGWIRLAIIGYSSAATEICGMSQELRVPWKTSVLFSAKTFVFGEARSKNNAKQLNYICSFTENHDVLVHSVPK
jgi:hypothetical protein